MLGELTTRTSGSSNRKVPSSRHPPRGQKTNINSEATEAAVEGSAWVGNGFARVGLIKPEGFGVVRITRQSRASQEAVERVVAFIQAHADAPGFLVTFAAGRRLTSSWLSKSPASSPPRTLSTPRANTATDRCQRTSAPSSTGYRCFEPPVHQTGGLRAGPGCVSSGEGFAKMMKCLRQSRPSDSDTRSRGGPSRSGSGRRGHGDVLALGGYAARRHAGRRPRRPSRDPRGPARHILRECGPDLGTGREGPEGKSQSDTETRNIDMVTHRSTAPPLSNRESLSCVRAGMTRPRPVPRGARRRPDDGHVLGRAVAGPSRAWEIDRRVSRHVRPWP